MEDFVSIICKNKKNKSKIDKPFSIIESNKLNSHSANESKRGENMFNINSDFINNNAQTYFSEKNNSKLEGLRKKFNFEEKYEPIICVKANISRKSSRYKEEDYSPMMNLTKNKKPNYLMKRYFIKDKSISPQEKSFQNNSICPIYDFYNCNSRLNSAEIDNLLQYSSSTHYHNYYKNSKNE